MPRPRRPAPLSLRLTPEDRQRLEQDAARMSLGLYRLAVVRSGVPPPRHRGKAPVKDQQAISALLGKLGRAGSPNVNQPAKAVHSGSLVLTPDLEAELHEAAADISAMRRLLVAALGLSESMP